jgi:outer membrane lipoprotein SlyB
VDQHNPAETDSDRDFELDAEEARATHASTGGAAAAGALTGGVIGLAGGPLAVAIGAVGGAIVGAAAERMMHSDDDPDHARRAPSERATPESKLDETASP